MDLTLYIIFLILFIGTMLLCKKYIKYQIKEGFGSLTGMSGGGVEEEEEEEEEEEQNLTPPKDAAGYEESGEVPPPRFKDSIYDFNLKYARDIWRELGCDLSSKYSPSVDNKDNLFGNVGWASEDYKFRVKSLNIEANKPEYNYYDWGKYKYKMDGKDTDLEDHHESSEGTTVVKSDEGPRGESKLKKNSEEVEANLWMIDTNKMGGDWSTTINRPPLVEFPMGIRKARTLCFGKDPGGYIMPKKGDKVKIKKTKKYDSPYFSGIVMTKNKKEEETKPIEVFWFQKGTASLDPISNKMSNYFNNKKCSIDNIATNEDGCTRDETKNDRPEVFIEKSDVKESIGWKLFGQTPLTGGNGQLDWFGYPNLEKKTGQEPTESRDEANVGRPSWKSRYLKGVKNVVPKKLANYDSQASTKTINSDDGTIDPKSVFKIKECQENSACEDLRCSTIVQKMKTTYPMTNVCMLEKKNNYDETNGLICKSGTKKGSTYTYYNEPDLCEFQDYGGNKDSANFPRTFCKAHCGDNCKPISKLKGGFTTSHYAIVYSEPNFKGNKAYVRGIDGERTAANLFPASGGSKRIKSLIVYGNNTSAMVWKTNQPSSTITPITSTGTKFPVPNFNDKMFDKTFGGGDKNSGIDRIEICKYSSIMGKGKATWISTSDSKSKIFDKIDLPKSGVKIRYFTFEKMMFGDQNWGNQTHMYVYGQKKGFTSRTYFARFYLDHEFAAGAGRGGWNTQNRSTPNNPYGVGHRVGKVLAPSFNWTGYEILHNVFRGDQNIAYNKYAEDMYKISNTGPYDAIILKPSYTGSGHASVYLNFGKLHLFESLSESNSTFQ